MHFIGHLADQAKKMEPLASLSSMLFESTHFHLKVALAYGAYKRNAKTHLHYLLKTSFLVFHFSVRFLEFNLIFENEIFHFELKREFTNCLRS